MTDFDPAVVAAVLAHMNDDHRDDNLRIVQAFGRPQATGAEMVGLDEHGGVWWVDVVDEGGGDGSELRVAWPAGPISERTEIRREVVALHEEAVRRLS
ncbi:DUF2470 domain-containing protein [Nocardioides sp.]|uniref:DUF2470 domain-containing protein n=1 Tax=Nocardioides sp. TaxID=35761 RepID=UPI002726280C|nr:DUF2470 domain-containing protein [Nocardioides sp.]MDO9455185.1 DUF2470 domain-containing protein [Nocardioides sp.]